MHLRTVATMIAFPLACVLLGAASGIAASPGAWYAELNKPDWTPPGWVFGPVWTILYAIMGVSTWLVWRRRHEAAVVWPLTAFGVQLVLNLIWSPLFFGLQRPDLAFFDIAVLLVAIVATIALFARVSRPAAVLLTPYLAWVLFAAALNFTIWRMNA